MTKPSYKSQGRLNLATKPLLLVLSGPSGSGKDAVLARMKELQTVARALGVLYYVASAEQQALEQKDRQSSSARSFLLQS